MKGTTMSDVTNREVGSGLVVVEHAGERDRHPNYLIVYTHTLIFYWWPVWAYGFIMAALTWFGGDLATLRSDLPPARFYPNNLLGLVFVIVFLLTFLFTNI